jgi:hypothetical protein
MMTRIKKSNVKDQEEVADDKEDADIGDENDKDVDFDMMDSNYEIIEGDDDLFVDHVDEDEDQVKKPSVHGKEKVERDGDSE